MRLFRLSVPALVASTILSCAMPAVRPVSGTAIALPADLDLIAGPAWHGTLTYLDYKKNRPVSIPSSLLLTRLPGDPPSWQERVGYDDEPEKNEAATLSLAADGHTLDSERVISREVAPDGAIRITTETSGEDDNRPALLRHVWTLAASRASLQKLVRFEGTSEFFERHRYEWTR
jgi:hypothetical protein